MALDSDQRRHFRTLGHELNPVVMLAEKGLTESVLAELTRALNDHELIKIRVSVNDREVRANLINQVCDEAGAELIQTIGKVALIFKKAEQPNPKLSNLMRTIHGK